MTKFFKKKFQGQIQKTLFLGIFGPFPQFWGQKRFFHEIDLLCTTS